MNPVLAQPWMALGSYGPFVSIDAVDRTKISRVSGKDLVTVDFSAEQGFIEYMARIVSDPADGHTLGTLVEQDTVGAAGGALGTPILNRAVTLLTANGATYSTTLASAVTAAAGREVIIGIGWIANSGTSAGTINTVTVGGVSATRLASAYFARAAPTASSAGVELWRVDASSGFANGASVVIDPTSAVLFGMHVFVVQDDNLGSVQDNTGEFTNSGDAPTIWTTGQVNAAAAGRVWGLMIADGVQSPGGHVANGSSTQLSTIWDSANDWQSAILYRDVAIGSNYSVGGTMNNSANFGQAATAASIAQSAGSSETEYQIQLTDDELVAASAAEGSNLLKVFVKTAAGVWSQ